MRVAYARGSTTDQSPELQLEALRCAGCERICSEKASGAKADRPELARVLNDVLPRGHVLVVLKFDGLARSLKKLITAAEDLEERGIAVPIPPGLATMLDLVFGIRGLRGAAARASMWPFSRATAWRRVKEVLAAAGIEGAQASPKGLRHALGVAAVGKGIPLNMVQRWLGHAQLTTTAIYAEAVGEEERAAATRIWPR